MCVCVFKTKDKAKRKNSSIIMRLWVGGAYIYTAYSRLELSPYPDIVFKSI